MSVSLPSFWQRLNNTRMRDVVRGRIDGRLDWRRPIYEAELPREAASLVTNVARRTKLWRNEKTDVAEELVAHFQDGLNAGHSVESLIQSFGEPGQAARLIRRAKKRGRPVLWQALMWTTRGLAIFLAVYLMLAVYYLLGDVSPTTNYLALLNREAAAVPEDERAWPLYREALVDLGYSTKETGWLPLGVRLESRPGDYDWPQLASFLMKHADSLAEIRAASARPQLGYAIGFEIHPEDMELVGEQPTNPPNEGEVHPPLFTVLLPHVQALQGCAGLLTADVYRAISIGDADTAYADVVAILGISQQLSKEPFIVSGLVGLGVERSGIDSIQHVLSERPEAWSDRQLIELAHRLSASRPDVTAWLESERLFSLDTFQRIYSDDGQGGGEITYEGLRFLGSSLNKLRPYFPLDSNSPAHDPLIAVGMPIAVSLMGSRREVVEEANRLFAMGKADLNVPLWDQSRFQWSDELERIEKSRRLSLRYAPISIVMPGIDWMRFQTERQDGFVDGAMIGIALELYRRERGDWPQSLDELVPRWLPSLPIDRINGGPLGYRIIDGRPVVYSLGNDTRDDGGRLPDECKGDRWKYLPRGPKPESHNEGDWVIWSAPAERAPVTEPAKSFEE
jgi:hypothetical protein